MTLEHRLRIAFLFLIASPFIAIGILFGIAAAGIRLGAHMWDNFVDFVLGISDEISASDSESDHV